MSKLFGKVVSHRCLHLDAEDIKQECAACILSYLFILQSPKYPSAQRVSYNLKFQVSLSIPTMTYSVLLLGATGLIGFKIANELSLHKDTLKRVAFLTPTAIADPEKEAKYSEVPLERVSGALDAAHSYTGN